MACTSKTPVVLLLTICACIYSGNSTLLRGSLIRQADTVTGCADLTNQGTYFTVGLEVGTPPQQFDVVADTGSDSVIIPSCLCKNCIERGQNRCFRGTNRSSTFRLPTGPSGVSTVRITFGSGPIQSAIASDVVTVGNVKAYMEKGVLLMTDNKLKFSGPFEGILGLGLPRGNSMIQELVSTQSGEELNNLQTAVAEAEGLTEAGSLVKKNNMSQINQVLKKSLPSQAEFHGISFLQRAGIHRFSMCFGAGSGGRMRLGGSRNYNALGSIGKQHWGLSFQGISVGDIKMEVKFCTETEKKTGQLTACGALPDSGTTAITGPKWQVSMLKSQMCDAWKRCSEAYNAQKAAADALVLMPSKPQVFDSLMLHCATWMTEPGSMKELPDLYFHVTGSEGRPQTLKLSGWSYVIKTVLPSSGSKQCVAAISVMDYYTQLNGPVWILGSPLFYEYEVTYEFQSSPPAISFSSLTENPCGSCSNKPALVSQGSFRASHNSSLARFPRQITGTFRRPSIDTSQPL